MADEFQNQKSELGEVQRNENALMNFVDDELMKRYLLEISNMTPVPNDIDITTVSNDVRMFEITKLVYEKDEIITEKLQSMFNALAGNSHDGITLVIKSTKDDCRFFMGVKRDETAGALPALYHRLEQAIKGQFPGTITKLLRTKEGEYDLPTLASEIASEKIKNIASVSVVPGTRQEKDETNENFVQGIEKLVLSMQGKEYIGVFVAQGTTSEEVTDLRRGYENLASQLSGYAESTHIKGTSTGLSLSHGVTKTRGTSDSHTHSTSTSTSTSSGWSLILVNGSSSRSSSSSTSDVHGTMKSTANSSSESKTDTTTESEQRTFKNHYVINILNRIDDQINRIKEFEGQGMWLSGAYFVSERAEVASTAAQTYHALMRGKTTGVEISAVNSWNKSLDNGDAMQTIQRSIATFSHPTFMKSEPDGAQSKVSPAVMVSGSELATALGLPRESVPGLPVIQFVNFGYEVNKIDANKNNDADVLELGNVYNQGQPGKLRVGIDVPSLAAHTFITGSTGTGKSNTVYNIIKQLQEKGLGFLVIEPAKGEYKNVFGSEDAVSVFGTNPNKTPMLKINPFSFPADIHVLEHIDRLIDIFNVSWPLYAAMPVILKKAIVQAYEACGWDMNSSENNVGGRLFPNFIDVLEQLHDVIDNSEYSAEVKGNYVGSLVTRVESLTNGLYGQIFSNNELDTETLFDSQVIVDLSRVGSLETKALIMGMLVTKLNEYRMTQSGMNRALQHVTIIEEAHNILPNTQAKVSGPEGGGLADKSVELIASAIAEMRSYGEGFVIVDQSPANVDMSAIRNTNTKIIMRLPEKQDRMSAGSSIGLSDIQIEEIARFAKGVAVVYQNDWLEPILVMNDKADVEENDYEYSPDQAIEEVVFEELISSIVNYATLVSVEKSKLVSQLQKCNISGAIIRSLMTVKDGKSLPMTLRNKLIYKITAKTCFYDIPYPTLNNVEKHAQASFMRIEERLNVTGELLKTFIYQSFLANGASVNETTKQTYWNWLSSANKYVQEKFNVKVV